MGEATGSGVDREPLLRHEFLGSAVLSSGSVDILTASSESHHVPINIQVPPCEYSVEESAEHAPPPPPVLVYRRRWYILLMFALVSATQGGVWGTWGPIATSTQVAFGWSEHTTALLANWGPIAYVIGMPFFAWLVGDKGIRVAVLAAAGLVAAGSGLRCISTTPPRVTYLVHAGQMLNGLAGPIAFGASTVVSATWFPANQRTTATAIGTIFNGFGCAVPSLLGPFVVSQGRNVTNGTVPIEEVREIRKEISHLMYMTFGWSLLLFILVFVYYPSKPSSPPSRTASVLRTDYIPGLRQILKSKQFWILSLSFAVPTGFSSGLVSILDSDLNVIGVSQISAGWMGFLSGIIGNIIALVLGIFSDTFTKHMKCLVLSCYTVSLVALLIFIGIYIGLVPTSTGLLWTSYLLFTVGVWAPAPVFFELAAEINYPVAEGTSHGFITWLCNLIGMVFLLVVMVPSINTSWINWSLIGSLVVSIPLMCFFRENYSRLDIDTQQGGGAKRTRRVVHHLHGTVTPHPLYN